MIVKRALEEPIRNIVENAGLEGAVIVEKVKAEKVATRGFDAESLQYVDMISAGIIDPTKVERVALQNAASVAEPAADDRGADHGPAGGQAGGGAADAARGLLSRAEGQRTRPAVAPATGPAPGSSGAGLFLCAARGPRPRAVRHRRVPKLPGSAIALLECCVPPWPKFSLLQTRTCGRDAGFSDRSSGDRRCAWSCSRSFRWWRSPHGHRRSSCAATAAASARSPSSRSTTAPSFVAAERLATILKGTWKAKGTRGATLTVGSRSAQFTRNDARVVVGGTAMTLAAPVRLGASGWLVPEDFLGKALARLAPGVTSARVPSPTAASVKPTATPAKAVARPPGPGVAFGDLRLRSYPTFTRIVLETAGSIAYVVDPASGGAVRVRLRGLQVSGPHAREVDDGLVKALRLEAGDGEATLRVTLDGDAGEVQHYALLDPFRVVIDIYRPKEPTVPGPRGGPVAAPLQLIVLDAGHGGHDPGATGPSGLTEKEVVLDVTRRVARMVEESRLGVKVVLTRSTDVFVPLRDRTNFANKQRADLFLSIHANAHPRSVSEGVETYFLSSEATDNEARQVAAIENGVVQLESQGTRQRDRRAQEHPLGPGAVRVPAGVERLRRDRSRTR